MTTAPQPIHPAPRCRDCGVELEPGALVEAGQGPTVSVVRWTAGVPQPGWLGEVAKRVHNQGVRTLTYRCPKCFRLESFAPPPAP